MTQPPYPPADDPYQPRGGSYPPPSGGQYPSSEPYAAGNQPYGGQPQYDDRSRHPQYDDRGAQPQYNDHGGQQQGGYGAQPQYNDHSGQQQGGYGAPPQYNDHGGQHSYGTPAQQPYGSAAAPVGYQTSDEKTYALIAHFGGVLGAIPALVVYLIKGKESPTVRAHAVAALNFQLITTATLIILTLVGFCGGFFLPWTVSMLLSLASTGVWIAGLVFAVIAGLKANQGELYRYPVSLKVVK